MLQRLFRPSKSITEDQINLSVNRNLDGIKVEVSVLPICLAVASSGNHTATFGVFKIMQQT